VYIRHANGIETVGTVLEVRSPELLSFTYGYASGKPIPPGSSRVTISLEPHADGTLLKLIHEFPEAAPRDEHVQGWRFQLSLFANLVANEVHAGAAEIIDEWYHAWTIAEVDARGSVLAQIVSPEIGFHDRFSLLAGLPDLSAHIGAALRFMPDITLKRNGKIRHCQGTVLCDWVAIGADGKELMTGMSVFALNADGMITSVTGFTNG
jgi:hypothetical protein